MENTKENSAKLILSNYSAKFTKTKNAKISNIGNQKGVGDEMSNRAGFYKKYLITSD